MKAMKTRLDFTTLKELGNKMFQATGKERDSYFTQLRVIHTDDLEAGLQIYLHFLQGMYWRAQWHGSKSINDLENANTNFDNILLLSLKLKASYKDWKYYYYRAETKLEILKHTRIPEEIEGLKVVCNDIIKKGLSFNNENEKLLSLQLKMEGFNG